MAYDMDIFGNCEGLFYCLAAWSNTVTDGYFWSIILFAFGIVLFMGSFNFGVNRAFGYSSTSVGILSLIMVQMDLIPIPVLTFSLILACAGVVAMFIGER